MYKDEGLRWNTLEGDPKERIKIQPIPAGNFLLNLYSFNSINIIQFIK